MTTSPIPHPAAAVTPLPLVVILHSRQPLTTDPAVTFDPVRWETVVLTDAETDPVVREDAPGEAPAVRRAPREGWAEAIRELAGDRPVQIVTNDEYCLISCAELRAEFGLPARHPAQPAHYIDKVLMKERLAAAGVRVPRFLALDEVLDDSQGAGVPDPETLTELVSARIGGPVVAKPRREANSRGVSILRTREELRDWLAGHRGERGWQIEEYLDGTFHHVNGLVRDGATAPVQTGTYLGPLLDLPSGRRLGGWTVPHDSELARRAHALNHDVVAALGGEGAFVVHTEFAVTGDDELVVVEVAGRAPGALVSELARLHAGLNLEEVNLALQAGLPVPEPHPTGTEAAWVWIPVMPGERYRHTPDTKSERLVHVRQAARQTHTGTSGAIGVSVLLWHTDPDVLAVDVRTAATAAWCGA
ncbi:acetyl-CoA carboxylase biotin carboxylase subunit family protein [Streptomyces sp. NPDC051243]|uniref:acetyl-CoA carboxylase biotin carboxylase subunit family protein n=1 Tax=Streptomyces sp. NPDC051243 TaxID=3365646 RepID=UPI00379098AE